MAISMIATLVIPYATQSDYAYYSVLLLCFIIGLCVATLQTTLIAFASMFSKDDYMGSLFAGTGVAGILICVAKIIFIGALGNDPKNLFFMTLGYFIISIITLVLATVLYLKFRKTTYCK